MLRRSASIRSPVQPVKYVCAYVNTMPSSAGGDERDDEPAERPVSPRVTSSTARPTRYGGASATAVAPSSETIASAVRALYGRASR